MRAILVGFYLVRGIHLLIEKVNEVFEKFWIFDGATRETVMSTKSHSRVRSSGGSSSIGIGVDDGTLEPLRAEEESGDTAKSWGTFGYGDDRDNFYHKDINRNITTAHHDNKTSTGVTSSSSWPRDFVTTAVPNFQVVIVSGGRWKNEKLKTFLSLLLLGAAFVVNTTSIALTHDRVPDRGTVPPLPDIVLDNITPHPELMELPDVFVMISIVSMTVIILLHPSRWIVGRRIAFILALLYLMRSVTMFVTVLPVANYTVYCAPKANVTSMAVVGRRVWQLLVGGGMQISGQKQSCGDYIYSGHTVMMLTAMLTVREYGSSRFWILKHFLTLITWTGMGILLLARGHYTVDVIIGYYAATRTFWTYHMLAKNYDLILKSPDKFYYSQAWWFPLFKYFEKSIHPRAAKNKGRDKRAT